MRMQTDCKSIYMKVKPNVPSDETNARLNAADGVNPCH